MNPLIDNDPVVLVHGFGAKRVWMGRLQRRLCAEGWDATCWGYLSWVGSLERHAELLRAELAERCSTTGRVHIVAHSMGSIVTRVALSGWPQQGGEGAIGRVVMLAPPNHGARFARVVGPVVRPICPAIRQLSLARGSFVNELGNLPAEQVGVLAARFDWLVPHDSAEFQGGEFELLNGTHNSLLFQEASLSRVCRFLRDGSFTTR